MASSRSVATKRTVSAAATDETAEEGMIATLKAPATVGGAVVGSAVRVAW